MILIKGTLGKTLTFKECFGLGCKIPVAIKFSPEIGNNNTADIGWRQNSISFGFCLEKRKNIESSNNVDSCDSVKVWFGLKDAKTE